MEKIHTVNELGVSVLLTTRGSRLVEQPIPLEPMKVGDLLVKELGSNPSPAALVSAIKSRWGDRLFHFSHQEEHVGNAMVAYPGFFKVRVSFTLIGDHGDTIHVETAGNYIVSLTHELTAR